jgi:hypothetical protein
MKLTYRALKNKLYAESSKLKKLEESEDIDFNAEIKSMCEGWKSSEDREYSLPDAAMASDDEGREYPEGWESDVERDDFSLEELKEKDNEAYEAFLAEVPDAEGYRFKMVHQDQEYGPAEHYMVAIDPGGQEVMAWDDRCGAWEMTENTQFDKFMGQICEGEKLKTYAEDTPGMRYLKRFRHHPLHKTRV